MNADFAGMHMVWNNTLRCTGEDPEEYYRADARRVLMLFVFAAEARYAVDSETVKAALSAAPLIGALDGKIAGEAAQRLVLSAGPRALGLLAQAGGYTAFGLPARCPQLKGVGSLPAEPAVRWWIYLRRSGADPEQDVKIAEALALDAQLPELWNALDELSFLAAPPEDRLQLKRVLSRLPENLPYDAAVSAFALRDARWNAQHELYAGLLCSGEPYQMSRLAVTDAELAAAHLPAKKRRLAMREMLDAVIASPQLNFPQALMAMLPLFR